MELELDRGQLVIVLIEDPVLDFEPLESVSGHHFHLHVDKFLGLLDHHLDLVLCLNSHLESTFLGKNREPFVVCSLLKYQLGQLDSLVVTHLEFSPQVFVIIPHLHHTGMWLLGRALCLLPTQSEPGSGQP